MSLYSWDDSIYDAMLEELEERYKEPYGDICKRTDELECAMYNLERTKDRDLWFINMARFLNKGVYSGSRSKWIMSIQYLYNIEWLQRVMDVYSPVIFILIEGKGKYSGYCEIKKLTKGRAAIFI